MRTMSKDERQVQGENKYSTFEYRQLDIGTALPFLPTFCCVQRGKGPANEKDKVHDNAGSRRERKRDEILN